MNLLMLANLPMSQFKNKRITLARWLTGAAAALVLGGTAMAQSITPITWNVVGLDSNNVATGPNVFPIGARICNNTASATTGTTWQAKFNWVTTSSYITLTSPSVLTVPSLAPGACQDVFHEVTVSRNSAAYDQKAQYNIEVVNSSGASLGTPVKTPTNREIYVERLISQNRNAVTGISVDGTAVTLGSGSVSLNEGQIYTIKLDGKTATQGYEQLEQFLGLSSDLFVVKSVRSTFSANAGTDVLASTKLYADGCGWQNDITATSTYHNNLSCSGTGKYGGVTSVTYVVQVKTGAAAAAPSGRTTNALLYDFSGSSYHYNSDFSTSAVTFNFATTPPPVQIDLAMAKTAALINSGNGTFTLSVTNTSGTTATGVTVTDTLPNGYDFKPLNSQNAAPAGTTLTWTPNSNSARTLSWNIGSLGAGQTISYTVSVSTNNGQTNYVNEACVTGNETDPNTSNNCSTAQVPEALADLAISKVANNFTAPLKVGDTLSFAVKVVNLGPSAATGVVVSDIVPAGYGSVSATCSLGTLSQSGSTYSCNVGNLAVGTTPTTVLTINATVLTTADPTVLSGYQNTATVTSTSNDPVAANNSASASQPPTFLTIAKTASSNAFTTGSSTGTYTLTVTKRGTIADLGTLTVTDSLPPGVSLTGYTSVSGWTCIPGTFPSTSIINCTRADDILTGTTPALYPDIVLGVQFSGPTAPILTNRALVSSIKNGVVTSYDETSYNVSWTNSVSYYTVVASVTDAATGSASCTPSPVTSGSSSVCTAVPAPGYVFSSWSGDCSTAMTATCNLPNIASDKSSVATFVLAPTYTVAATVAAGTGTASCVPSTVSAGGTSVCTATGGAGWSFTGWTGACAGQGAVCTLSNISTNVASAASFVILTNPATATVTVGTGTAVCVPATVDFGGTTVCTATAGSGWTFTGWTGACAGQGAVCTLTNVTAPVNSAASFVANTPAPIPTLSEWAMIFLASLMGLFAVGRMRRRD